MQTAYSSHQDLAAAVDDLRASLTPGEPSLVVYFASSRYDANTLAAAMQAAFPRATTLGCTTSGEIVSGHMLEGTIVAMGMGRAELPRVAATLVDDVHDAASVPRALAALEGALDVPLRELDPSRWVGLVLVDGMSGGEEKVMDALSARMNVPFVGGSAGDDARFVTTHVMANGVRASNAAALALLELPAGYAILKTQSFDDTGKCLRVTKADVAARTVIELDGRPAAEAYAEAVGVPVEALASRFMVHPLGLMVDGEPYVRSPQQTKGTSVVFYCNIAEGMELHVLQSRDIVADTRAFLDERLPAIGNPRGMIVFNCILRGLELQAKEQSKAYGELFSDIPTVGFSTYGEQYVGHINQTATMLVLR